MADRKLASHSTATVRCAHAPTVGALLVEHTCSSLFFIASPGGCHSRCACSLQACTYGGANTLHHSCTCCQELEVSLTGAVRPVAGRSMTHKCDAHLLCGVCRCPCSPSRTGASSSATSLCAQRRLCASRRRRRCVSASHVTICMHSVHARSSAGSSCMCTLRVQMCVIF